MRVISGSARGRRLQTPPGMRVRPTADRVKEALFSMLVSRKGSFNGKKVLDLFAGVGSLGIEALSRGACNAVFVDNHRESAELIDRNIVSAGLSGKGRVTVRDAVSALHELERAGERFDIVFLDPPYGLGLVDTMLTALASSRVLTDDALVAAEFASTQVLPESFGVLQECGRRKYGNTCIALFEVQRSDLDS